MKTPVLCASLALLFLGCGCEENVYKLHMKLKGDVLERRLVCWREDPGAEGSPVKKFPVEDLTRIAEAYGVPVPEPTARKYAFSGTFTQSTPDDIGGTGFFRQITTTMGSVSHYSERFGGDDDLAAKRERSLSAVDRLVDLFVGYLETVLADEEGWPDIRAFMTGPLRHDLKNLGLYVSLPSVGMGSEEAAGKIEEDEREKPQDVVLLMRALHYLAERDYIRLDELPHSLLEWANSPDEGNELNMFLSIVLSKALTRKTTLAANDPVVTELKRLIGSKSLESALVAYAATTETWEKRLRAWEEERKADPDLRPPEPEELLNDTVEELIMAVMDEEEHRVIAHLDCPTMPEFTNGEWSEQERRVVWSDSVRTRSTLPTFFYASWTTPDEQFQTAHLGGVVLTADGLAQYVVWHDALDADKAGEWDTFLAGLEPDGQLRGKIETFLFSDGRGGEGSQEERLKRSLVNPVRSVLLDALEPTAP